jgi:hypothetical protein
MKIKVEFEMTGTPDKTRRFVRKMLDERGLAHVKFSATAEPDHADDENEPIEARLDPFEAEDMPVIDLNELSGDLADTRACHDQRKAVMVLAKRVNEAFEALGGVLERTGAGRSSR